MLLVAPRRGRAVLYWSPCSHWRSLPGLGWQLTMSQYYCPPYTWHPTLHTIASIIHWYQTHDNRVRVGISLQKMLSSLMRYFANFFCTFTTCHWVMFEWPRPGAGLSVPTKRCPPSSCEIVTQWGEEGGRARVWFIITHHYNEWSWTLDTGQTIDNGDSA